MAGFAGFSPQAMKFLKALKKNNEREWFQPRKEIYETEWRAPMIELVAALQADMARFAPDYVGEPAKAVLRIYRDTRFSKNKTPYKTHVAAALRRRGLSKDGSASFYFHIEEKGLLVAGGVYAPMPDELRAIRNHVSESYTVFQKLVHAPRLVTLMGDLQGETLSRVPKGFAADHPAATLLKKKQFYFAQTVAPDVIFKPEMYKELLKRIQVLTPVCDYLNQPLLGLATRRPPARDEFALL